MLDAKSTDERIHWTISTCVPSIVSSWQMRFYFLYMSVCWIEWNASHSFTYFLLRHKVKSTQTPLTTSVVKTKYIYRSDSGDPPLNLISSFFKGKKPRKTSSKIIYIIWPYNIFLLVIIIPFFKSVIYFSFYCV